MDLATFERDCLVKHAAGAKKYRKNGEGFVGDPAAEGYDEQKDSKSYSEELVRQGRSTQGEHWEAMKHIVSLAFYFSTKRLE